MPFTHSRACDPSSFATSRKPAPAEGEVAERTVLLLGDATDLESEHARQIGWHDVHALLLERSFNVTFVVPSSSPSSLPEHIKPTTANNYPALLGAADALLGIGTPHLSTLPYIGMCRGTPSVMPFFTEIHGRPATWTRYDARLCQHGEYYADEPEPFAYKYPIASAERLAYELGKALANGMEPQ